MAYVLFATSESQNLKFVAPSAFETTILPLTLSFRTDGIDSNSFMTGTNPTNDNKDSLLQAAEVAIDSILKNSGTLAELTLVNVTSVEDTSKSETSLSYQYSPE